MGQDYNVVFDINVYIDIANKSHNTLPCFKEILKNRDWCLITSKFIRKKAFEVLASKELFSEKDLDNFTRLLDILENRSQLKKIEVPLFGSEANTIGDLGLEDSHIFNLARKSGASIIVTSDSDFERVRNFDRSIAIVSPARFIKLTSPKKPPTKPSLGLQFGMNPLDFQPGQGGLGRQI